MDRFLCTCPGLNVILVYIVDMYDSCIKSLEDGNTQLQMLLFVQLQPAKLTSPLVTCVDILIPGAHKCHKAAASRRLWAPGDTYRPSCA